MEVPSFLQKRRYRFSRVLTVVAALYFLLLFFGVAWAYIAPAQEHTDWAWLLNWKTIILQVYKVVFYTTLYFLLLNIFHRFNVEKQPWIKYLQPVLLGVLALSIHHYISYNVEMQLVGKRSVKEDLPLATMVFFYAFAMVFHISLAAGIAYITFLRDEKKQNKILEEQKMQLEVEKTQANLNFLKAQINPHFLHNTLNFLYAKSLPYSEELSEGILTLSDIMRYALGPAARDGKVALKDEIEHVRNVVKINQLRFSNNLNVQFDVNGVVNGATTIPFLLITIVENAFKHGDLKSSTDPIEIRVDMLEGGRMHFFCRNRKKSGPKEMSTGIGLDNIKKQLDLTYGRNYSLNIKDEAEFYTTELTINAYDKLPGSR